MQIIVSSKLEQIRYEFLQKYFSYFLNFQFLNFSFYSEKQNPHYGLE